MSSLQGIVFGIQVNYVHNKTKSNIINSPILKGNIAIADYQTTAIRLEENECIYMIAGNFSKAISN